ncbi:MAG: CDGSH iron-sulfur domain-containing protein [Burkholderiales bacterium]|nr:MAG: CDGSH iron-sulfur domain-containing protein [Burkholderiales bacterium]
MNDDEGRHALSSRGCHDPNEGSLLGRLSGQRPALEHTRFERVAFAITLCRRDFPILQGPTMGDSRTPSIKANADGPYAVSGVSSLTNSQGMHLPVQDRTWLCRCGQSAKKPFCDGTHKKVGFSSARVAEAGSDRLVSYRGAKITIDDNRGICAHAGVCTGNLPSVWRMGEEPWIDPDAAEVQAIVEVIERCPSGALSYTIEGRAQEGSVGEATILVSKNGPYCVSGPVELADVDWAEGASRKRFTLCRCGASQNKPFCDGSHWDAGFVDDSN